MSATATVYRGVDPACWAVQVRLLVHAALDRDDMPAVRRLNSIADAAYAALGPTDCRRYMELLVCASGPLDMRLVTG